MKHFVFWFFLFFKLYIIVLVQLYLTVAVVHVRKIHRMKYLDNGCGLTVFFNRLSKYSLGEVSCPHLGLSQE